MDRPVANGHERRAALRKDEILAGAAEVFFERGFSRTSIDDVIDRVGGSKRTLYRHFANKEELFVAVIRTVSERAIPTIDLSHGEDLEKALVAFGVRYLETLLSHAGLAVFRAVLAEASHIPELGKAFLEAAPGRVTHALAEFFKQYNRANEIKIAKPEVTAAEFLALVRGDLHLIAMLRSEAPSAKEVRVSVENAVATFLHGAFDMASVSKGTLPSGGSSAKTGKSKGSARAGRKQ
ncbi:TetR/AcrR family transcriptional regulator [Roseixanthobacter glucoisosaccharinicivorans]|uniref:TetR/AcrR family transcriptional regulator n=1 Tax=Roseixanthobacter glucoisosaccharinicivorans TaxID=3119923 RepID=UPI00372A0B45